MGMNQTPASERVHIVFFGRRNAGKSSLMNAVTGQSLSVVSEIRGTTTDPVYKTMELLPLGPVVMVDSPGIDDEGSLGELRVKKSRQLLNRADIAVLVVDAGEGIREDDRRLLEEIKKRGLPYRIAWNKVDLLDTDADIQKRTGLLQEEEAAVRQVSAKTGAGIRELKEDLAHLSPDAPERAFLENLVAAGKMILLVIPIDKAAPKGRLILPQQMAVRAILDAGATPVLTREKELADTLRKLREIPKLVITDSQVFGFVAKELDRFTEESEQKIPLTSFSILMARYKGNLEQNVEGIRHLGELPEGSRILIAEGCTHHRQCGDIGTEKLPRWIGSYTGKQMVFEACAGTEFPEALGKYDLIIHCGGCMLTEREMKYRLSCAKDQGIPMTNYGIAIAEIHGILSRSLEPLEEQE